MIFFIILLLPFYSFAATSWENPKNSQFHVKIDLSSDKITLEDRLKIELNVTYPNGYLLDTSAARSHLMRQSGFDTTFFKLAQETIYPPTQVNDQMSQQRLVYELEPLLTGIQYLSFFDLPFKRDKQKSSIYTYIFPIKVDEGKEEEVSVMRSPLMNFDLTLPIALSPENRRSLIENPLKINAELERNRRRVEEKSIPWLAFLGAIVAGVFIALSLKKENKPETEEEKQRKVKTLKEESLDEINHVRREDSDIFFVETTDVVRHYIEKKFGIHASSQTTEEFLRNVETQKLFNETDKQLLEDFLNHADAVKFAKYAPSEKEKDNALEAAKKFITRT